MIDMKFVIPPSKSSNPGHYTPGVISNGMLYISGQLSVDTDTGKVVEGDITVHAKQALFNLERVLTAAGLTKEHVVQTRVYIPNVEHWGTVNQVYAEFFGNHKPARAIVPCRELHYGALVEIEAIAELEAK